jgi:fatty-acyl-CoA synthase
VGAILVNINPAYRANELAYALNLAGVSTLVSATGFRDVDYLDLLSAIRGGVPRLERVIVLGDDVAGGAADLRWGDLLEHRAPPDRLVEREAELDADDPINIQFTSGTTGNPKGATLTHHNILNNARTMAHVLGYTADDRVCVPVPLYHCFGMVAGNLCSTVSGAAAVYPSDAFDPLSCLQAIAEERCTSLYGVPTMFMAQLDHPRFAEFDLTSLRTGIVGGAPCPAEVVKRVVNDMHLSEISNAYGMTETSPASFMTRHDDTLDRRVYTAGTVLPHVEARIVDPATGRTAPTGAVGEVCVRGYLVMRGYWDDPAATAAAIDDGRWMHTGDLGVLDESGYLAIVGRIKEMVIRGGENIYPREIEEVLYQHPAVAGAQVFGIPDERMGEELMAWIVVREGTSVEPEELRAFCRERLARFKVPRQVKLVESFPMTVTGKTQKFRMREMAIEELGLQHLAGTISAAAAAPTG